MEQVQDPNGVPRPGWWWALPFLMVAALVALLDQATKLAVSVLIAENSSVPATGALRLTHVTNTGSAFGLLQGQTAFLVLASFIGIFGIVAYYRSSGQRSLALRLALGLVLGGAIGNLTDRLLRGRV
ncbi:MAG: signal peptidase II, partial [Chloroflexi bacterium]|nr:signal peptidase II [Chloroflexota bacterium]